MSPVEYVELVDYVGHRGVVLLAQDVKDERLKKRILAKVYRLTATNSPNEFRTSTLLFRRGLFPGGGLGEDPLGGGL